MYSCVLVFCVGIGAVSRAEHVKRAAETGQTVLLPCLLNDTNKDWQFHGDLGHHNITHNGVVTPQYSNRFQLHSQGLLIRDVQETDEGTYICVDHHHHRREISLSVPCESTF